MKKTVALILSLCPAMSMLAFVSSCTAANTIAEESK